MTTEYGWCHRTCGTVELSGGHAMRYLFLKVWEHLVEDDFRQRQCGWLGKNRKREWSGCRTEIKVMGIG